LGAGIAETAKQFFDSDDLGTSASAKNDVRDLNLGRLQIRKRQLFVDSLCGLGTMVQLKMSLMHYYRDRLLNGL
jgi:precorrin-6B methylase 2